MPRDDAAAALRGLEVAQRPRSSLSEVGVKLVVAAALLLLLLGGVGNIICTHYDPDFSRLRWQFGTVYVSFACDTNKPDRFYTQRGSARTLEGAAVINRTASKLTRLILLHDKQLQLGKKKNNSSE